MISIGAHLSGPELDGSPICRAIGAAMRAAMDARPNSQESGIPSLNVVFCVAGSFGRPDWDHGQIAKYSAKRKLLLVQVAVPEEVVSSEAPLDFVIRELQGANALAFEFYRQKGIQYPLGDAEKLVAQIREIADLAIKAGKEMKGERGDESECH